MFKAGNKAKALEDDLLFVKTQAILQATDSLKKTLKEKEEEEWKEEDPARRSQEPDQQEVKEEEKSGLEKLL